MTKQTLTQAELDAMVAAMDVSDFGLTPSVSAFELAETEIETLDDYEDDGQPSEYDEWQDVYGGDDWDHGQYDCDYYDGGVDF